MVKYSYVLLNSEHIQSSKMSNVIWAKIVKQKKLVVCLTVALLVTIMVLCLTIGIQKPSNQPYLINDVPDSEGEFETSDNKGPDGKGWGVLGNSDSILGSYGSAAVSADGVPCASIAKDILERGGSAADASIAGLFCVGVVNSQSMGLGGGFLLTYYSKANSTAYTLDARERAPLAATETMFAGSSSKSRRGGLSVAVPGELRGYYSLYQKFGGRVSWAELIEPSIKLCEEGHPVNWHMARALKVFAAEFEKEPSMSTFIDPSTGKVYKQDDVIKRPALAATLRAIQNNPDDLYTGPSADKLVEDLQKYGSIISIEDLRSYQPVWREPVSVSLGADHTLYSVPPPGSGLLVAAIANIIDETGHKERDVVAYQQLVEAFKYVYSRRTEMGDGDYVDMTKLRNELTSEQYASHVRSLINLTHTFNNASDYSTTFNKYSLPPNDHGTSHFSLVSPDGDAVSVTSTVNLYFGAGIVSSQTGIVLNDEMDDFSSANITNYFGVPPSQTNYITPGKRPLSSMAPTIIVNKKSGSVRLVIGAAGGTKIPSGIANVILHNFWRGRNIKQSVDARRLHHQFYPMTLMYEKGFDQNTMDKLESFGHSSHEFSVGGSVVCAIEVKEGRLRANSDFRKSGHVDGY